MGIAKEEVVMELSTEEYESKSRDLEKWRELLSVARRSLHKKQIQVKIESLQSEIKKAHKARYERRGY